MARGPEAVETDAKEAAMDSGGGARQNEQPWPEEGLLPYLGRSSAPWARAEVDLIDAALVKAPPATRDRWQKQLESHERKFAIGAYTEAMFATALWNRGYELQFDVVVEGGKTPDILAYREGHPAFFVEATCCLDGDPGADARLQYVTRAVDGLAHEDYWVSVGVRAIGRRTPSEKALQRALGGWLGALSLSDVGGPSLRWPETLKERSESGWDLTFSAFLRPESLCGSRGGCLLATHWAGACDSKSPLAKKLLEKAKKYPSLGLPYVIALNWLRTVPIPPFEVDCVLFGGAGCLPLDGSRRPVYQPLFDIAQWEQVEPQIAERRGEGFWRASSGKPRNRNVSAVLLMTNVCPGGHPSATWNLWSNAYATHSINGFCLGAPVVDAHPAQFPHPVLPCVDWPTALGVR